MRILIAEDEKDLNALLKKTSGKSKIQRGCLLRWGGSAGLSGSHGV